MPIPGSLRLGEADGAAIGFVADGTTVLLTGTCDRPFTVLADGTLA